MTVLGNFDGTSWRARAIAEMRRFASDGSGSTAIEYAVAAVLIAGAVIAAVSALTPAISDIYERLIKSIAI